MILIMETLGEKANRSSHVLVSLFLILASGIAGTGYLYCRYFEKHYRVEVERGLSAIADLKVDDMVQW